MKTKEIIKLLKKAGNTKLYLPRPRSRKNHIWKKIYSGLKRNQAAGLDKIS